MLWVFYHLLHHLPLLPSLFFFTALFLPPAVSWRRWAFRRHCTPGPGFPALRGGLYLGCTTCTPTTPTCSPARWTLGPYYHHTPTLPAPPPRSSEGPPHRCPLSLHCTTHRSHHPTLHYTLVPTHPATHSAPHRRSPGSPRWLGLGEFPTGLDRRSGLDP